MFTLLCNCRHWVAQQREKEASFVVAGLDNAGKTTLTKALQGKVVRDTRPTVGFQRGNEVQVGSFMLQLRDLGGGKKIRGYWSSYYVDAHGVIYVVDASDEARLEESRACLHELLQDPALKGKPLLVFANKQDLAGALSAPELSATLDLAHMKAKSAEAFHIEACQALTPEGDEIDHRLQQGLQWLLSAAAKQWKQLSARVTADCQERDEAERIKKEERKARVAKMKAERKAKQEAEAAAAAADTAQGGGLDDVTAPKLNVWSTDVHDSDSQSAVPPKQSTAVKPGSEEPSDAGSKPSSPGGVAGGSQDVETAAEQLLPAPSEAANEQPNSLPIPGQPTADVQP